MNTVEAHRHFTADCFNRAWTLLDLSERSPEQVRELLALSRASLFHWMNRDDCTPQNISIGLWQLARVYAIVESPLEAMRFAKDCLKVSETNNLSPFCMAYAHEAITRVALIAKEFSLAGACSRLINIQHRLVYQVLDDIKTVKVIRMWTHYE